MNIPIQGGAPGEGKLIITAPGYDSLEVPVRVFNSNIFLEMVDPSGTDNFSISAVIPTYNRVNLLRHALDSILSQSHQVNEIIVVDDGSTDNTVEKLSIDYKTVKFLEQNNLGVSSARI